MRLTAAWVLLWTVACDDPRALSADDHPSATTVALLTELGELERRADGLVLVPGPRGPTGLRGPRGPAGEPGANGASVSESLIDEFRAKVSAAAIRDGIDIRQSMLQLDDTLAAVERTAIIYQGILTYVRVADDEVSEH